MMSLVIKVMVIAAIIFGLWEAIQIILGLWVWSTVRKDVGDERYDEIMKMNQEDKTQFLVEHLSNKVVKGL